MSVSIDRSKISAGALCLLLLFGVTDLFGQCLSGSAEGTVFDRSGNPVQGAQIRVTSEACAMNGILPLSYSD